jgi:hypothetical protein
MRHLDASYGPRIKKEWKGRIRVSLEFSNIFGGNEVNECLLNCAQLVHVGYANVLCVDISKYLDSVRSQKSRFLI